MAQWLLTQQQASYPYQPFREATMGRSQGNSYRPTSSDPPHAGLGGGPQCDENGAYAQQQGEWAFADTSYRINIYGAVDSWRSYSDGNGSLAAATNPSFNLPIRSLNPAASTFEPGKQAQSAQSRASFTPYQQLRVSIGVHDKQVIRQYAKSQPRKPHGESHGPIMQNVAPIQTSNRRSQYDLQPKETQRDYSSDRPIPSIESANDINPTEPRPGLSALRRPVRQCAPRRTVTPPPAPMATKEYLGQAQSPTNLLDAPRRLLVILDLNGTLIVKPNRYEPKKFKTRPGLSDLFGYLFKHHVVMIYTSSRPVNAHYMVEILFTSDQRKRLAAVWARDKLELTKAQYLEKVQVYKNLDRIWKDKSIQAKCPDGLQWNQSNTILVDDSHLKALSQPYNLLQVPEFTIFSTRKASKAAVRKHEAQQEEVLKSLVVKLEELKWQADVSKLIWRWQTGKEEIPNVSGSGLLVDEKVDHKELAETEARMREILSPSPAVDLGPPIPRLEGGADPDINDDDYDDLAVDDEKQIVAKIQSLSVGSGKALSESPVPEAVFSDLLGGESK